MLECVPNVSEGRDPAILGALATACGDALLDLHHDGDHHRSVFTLAAPDPSATASAVRALAAAVAEHLDISEHRGVHPRLGALDVVPFVDVLADVFADVGSDLGRGPRRNDEASTAAREFATWVADEFSVPVFFYGDATPSAPSLPEVRRDAFTTLRPDLGPDEAHPRMGAVAVGVRPVMIAVNVEADTDDVEVVRRVAASVRARDGGLPGVRALGFALESTGGAQVSMNLVDLAATGVEKACTTVRTLLDTENVEVKRVELVGLLPASEFNRTAEEFRRWSGISEADTIEARLSNRRG